MKIVPAEHVLIFVHIQKTAGQTLRAILHEKYGSEKCLELGHSAHHTSMDQLKMMSYEKCNGHQCVMAHLPYGLHTYFDRPPCYITLLREPLERAASQFFYICRTPTNERFNALIKIDFSFLSYTLRDEFGRPDNMQIRYIINDFKKKQIDSNDLKRAKDVLLNHFTLFGITERFDETIGLFEMAFSWGRTQYKDKNVTKNRPAISALHPKALRILKEKYYYDAKLYEFAFQHFEQNLKKSIL